MTVRDVSVSVILELLYIMLFIMYNNAMGEYLWVLRIPNILCYQ